jgi:hypothetical protein
VVLKAAPETTDKRYIETRGNAIFNWNDETALITRNKNKNMKSKMAYGKVCLALTA